MHTRTVVIGLLIQAGGLLLAGLAYLDPEHIHFRDIRVTAALIGGGFVTMVRGMHGMPKDDK